METAPSPNELQPVPGTLDYYATVDGRIWDAKQQRWPKLSQHSLGYVQMGVRQPDGTFKPAKVHRLVAMAFLPNPENKYSVNHKDGNKTNNAVANLEWATMKENIQQARLTGLLTTKAGTESPLYGRSLTPEIRRKLSDAKKGERHPKFSGTYLTPKGEFAAASAAACACAISTRQILRLCKGGAHKAEGWDFRPTTAT